MARNPIETLARLERQLDKRVAGVLNKHARRLKEKLRADQPLKARGPRRFPYLSRPAQWEGGKLLARVFSPVSWAKVHIGPRGTMTIITPKAGRFLALPTDFVKRFRGHPVSPGYYAQAYKFVHRGIIFARVGGAGGPGRRARAAAGEKYARGDLVPLYILKQRVVIRRRIHPEVLLHWVKPGFLADLKKVLTVGGKS